MYKNSFSILFFFTSIIISACSSTSSEDSIPTKEPIDSNKTEDISENFLQNDIEDIEDIPEEKPRKKRKRKRGPSADKSAAITQQYKDYQRQDNSPEELAKDMIWTIINMCYQDDFNSASIEILQRKEGEKFFEIDIRLKWTDKWVNKPYEIEGTLKTHHDGTNIEFKIHKQNLQVDALEVTNENFITQIQLDQI